MLSVMAAVTEAGYVLCVMPPQPGVDHYAHWMGNHALSVGDLQQLELRSLGVGDGGDAAERGVAARVEHRTAQPDQ